MTSALKLRLFKLRIFDDHCHIVASHDDMGRAIDVPGVDIRGAAANVAFDAAFPLFEMLRKQSAASRLRAVSVHLERRRVLATFEPQGNEAVPSVLRIDEPAAFEAALSMAAPVMQYLSECAAPRLAARRADRQAPETVTVTEHGTEPVPTPLVKLEPAELRRTSLDTLHHYSSGAESFWRGTRDHDVSQNVAALLRNLSGDRPHTILDLGCGPGRDLKTFHDLGHIAVGLDGAAAFVEMARSYSGCEVIHQDFLNLTLVAGRFDGVFANASLFHVPSQELPRVLEQLRKATKVGGVILASNPRGANQEGWSADRYCSFLELDTFRRFMRHAGFDELEHYYRPAGEPRHRQPWAVSIWRRQ